MSVCVSSVFGTDEQQHPLLFSHRIRDHVGRPDEIWKEQVKMTTNYCENMFRSILFPPALFTSYTLLKEK